MRLVLVAALLASTPSHAFAPHKGATDRIPAGAPRRSLAVTAPAAARAAFAPLAQRGWRASWDEESGVPAWLAGGFVAVPGATADPARAEAAARAFLAAHVALLAPGVAPSDFVVVANHFDGERRTVGFAQTFRGLRVIGGRLGFVFARDRLFAIGSSAQPHVAVDLARPRASAAAMRGRAESWIAADTGVVARARGGGERAILRTRGAYHLVDVVEVAAERGPERWDVYVDAAGTPLGRHPRVRFASGTLAYDAPVRYPGGGRDAFPAGAAQITVNTMPVTTGATGDFSWAGTSPATVTPGLVGTYVEIVNQAGALATATLTAQPGGQTVWSLATDETQDAQLATFIYGNLAKARARTINPSAAAWIDSRLRFFVNEPGECNAYSTGDEVHFFRASASCENTGRLADVVFHEFGHSLHNHSLIGGMGAFESHLSEGLADFFAANITGDPAVGRGFFLDDGPLRHIDPRGSERVYPIDFDFDPHVSGLIIAGALWDLRKALVAELGSAAGVARTERVFAGIMARASDISRTFTAALVADDDDADLGNGTPSFCAIERAFGRHGLVPGYESTVVHPPVLDGTTLAIAIEPPPPGPCAPLAVTRVSVAWRIGDGVATVFDLVQDGAGWRGALPELPDGTSISYSVDIDFDDGSTQAFPANPADPSYQLVYGTAEELWCERFDTDPAWAQTSNLGFEWEWARPPTPPRNGDPAAAYAGDHVLGTDISADGLYRAKLIASIATPPIDTSRHARAQLQYRRWLSVEDALYDQAMVLVGDTVVWRNAGTPHGTLDHVDREWRFHAIDLTPHAAAGSVQLAWALTTDFGKELGGWAIDEVCVVGLSPLARCGDGFVDDGEQCDDGNTTNDDGCDEACAFEITAGGGGCCGASGGPGSLALALALVGLAARRRRGGRSTDQRAARRRCSSAAPSRSVSARMPK